MPVTKTVFDESAGVTLYKISNKTNTLSIGVIDYGATLVNLLFQDRAGKTRDLVLGFDDLDGYQSKRLRNPYFGASVGRVANRIAAGSFSLNGERYQLPINSGSLTLHGGPLGFDKRQWSLAGEGESSVTLAYTAEDGEQGFPGRLRVEIKFSVTDDNEVRLEYCGRLGDDETKATPINLTNHSYFNLNGASSAEASKIRDHMVRMASVGSYLEVDSTLIPTGKLTPVARTDFDFGTWHAIGERTDAIAPAGYDHCFVVEPNADKYATDVADQLKKAVEVYAPQTGILMTMSTTEPGVQFYAGSKILEGHVPKATQAGSGEGVVLGSYSGFCLEAQRFPDAINQRNWQKQVVLEPGMKYKQITVYKFACLDSVPM